MLTRRAQRLAPPYLRPPAVWVGAVGLAATLAVLVLPPLDAYASAWYVPLLLTAVCYGLLIASQTGAGQAVPRVRDPDLDTVLRLRRQMEQRLAALRPDDPLTGEVSGLLRQLDRELIPSLQQLVARRQALAVQLLQYEQAGRGGVRPDEATLKRLRALHERQNGAVREVVQQVVNMDASLLGLIEEGDQTLLAEKVQEWAQEIDLRWRSVAEVLGVK